MLFLPVGAAKRIHAKCVAPKLISVNKLVPGGRMRRGLKLLAGFAVLCSVIAVQGQEAPIGSPSKKSGKEEKKLEALKEKVQGKVVWSTSRSNSKHDIWIMNADGTEKKPLTKSENNVDWFSRFSPSGSKVLFTRSKIGWVNEMDAEVHDKWDLWLINTDGSNEEKIVENAAWGTWRPSGDSIVFARGPKVFVRELASGQETEIFDCEDFFEKEKVYAQQPQLSPNGKFLAITVRGTIRQTGIYNRESNEWHTTGAGCQINWFPDNSKVLRMNEGQGNMGTEVLAIPVDEAGKPTVRIKGLSVPKKIRLMDLPGRRSHEYFPQLDQGGKWMVWAATQYGHEHDIVDYDLFIWDITTNKKKDFVRLTFHSGNDRWPDIHTGEIAAAEPASSPAEQTMDEPMEEDAESMENQSEMEEDAEE